MFFEDVSPDDRAFMLTKESANPKKHHNGVMNHTGATTMPTVKAEGKTFICESGTNLRQVMLDNGVDVYNGAASVINCHGLGTCGTCAVQVEGAVSEPEWREKTRLSLPPHSLERGRRLSCQVKVLGDVSVTKYDGFWGQDDRVLWTPEQAV